MPHSVDDSFHIDVVDVENCRVVR